MKRLWFVFMLCILAISGCSTAESTNKETESKQFTKEDQEYLEQFQALQKEYQTVSVEFLKLMQQNKGSVATPDIDKKMFKAGSKLITMHFTMKNIQTSDTFKEPYDYYLEAFKSLASAVTLMERDYQEEGKNMKTFERLKGFNENWKKGDEQMEIILAEYGYEWTSDGAVKNE